MSLALEHRGPDDHGRIVLPGVCAEFRRLSIVDLSEQGHQPMGRGPLTLLFNGEIYNHLELRVELESLGETFASTSDSEVLLAAYAHWGPSCLERFLGMFAIAIWDERDHSLFLARDRFGVKPLYTALLEEQSGDGRSLAFASEIGALQAAGFGTEPNRETWARFLTDGAAERGRATFWVGVERLGAGELATFRDGVLTRSVWYNIEERIRSSEQTELSTNEEAEERLAELLEDSVRLRFRADVPVGINLSGGLDSSLLIALCGRTQGAAVDRINAFTFITGDERYDELPWVQTMLAGTGHPHHVVRVAANEIPSLAASVAKTQREPSGGIATLAYAKLFEAARNLGVKVLLDGQGVDETWAGYDYYQRYTGGASAEAADAALVQGSVSPATRPQAVDRDLRALVFGAPPKTSQSHSSPLIQRQLFDIQQNKLPRALRYNDRVSMRASVELREPFLDHRLVEFGLAQPPERKIKDGVGKALPRLLAARWLPKEVSFAPKRPLQTPQREWLRGELRDWGRSQIEAALATGWLDQTVVEREWRKFDSGEVDNAFFVWQWIDLGMLVTAT